MWESRLVEAVFNAEDRGHMDLFSGSLKEVKRMEHWRSRNELAWIPTETILLTHPLPEPLWASLCLEIH
jgi:hypothetical protein